MSTRLFAGVLAGLALLSPFALAAAPPGAGPLATAERELQRRLSLPVRLDFENAPLREVLADLRTTCGINIVEDLPTLHEAGVSLDSPVTIKLDQVPLRSALNLILAQVKLTDIVNDGVLWITTKEVARGTLVTRTHPVADLLSEMDDEATSRVCAAARNPGASNLLAEKLLWVITNTIRPRSWSATGGDGTIDYFPNGQALVVKQTPDVHEKVADLLDALRRQRKSDVTMEMRFLTVSDECLAKLGLGEQQGGKPGPSPGVAILDDAQVKVLLETAQADPKSAVIQAPKLTCQNRQKGTIELMDRQAFVTGMQAIPNGQRMTFRPQVQTMSTGLNVSVLPIITWSSGTCEALAPQCLNAPPPERKVKLQFAIHLARQDAARTGATSAGPLPAVPPRCSTLTLEKTFEVPDGRTALLSGWSVQREAHNEVAPPLIGPLPAVGQLFRTLKATRQKEHLLVLVTPRIVVPPNREEKVEAVARPQGGTEASEAKGEPSPPAGPPPPPLAGKPASVTHVNSRSFTLTYEVDNEGPSKVAAVVVWYTRDGKTWTSYPEQLRPTRAVPITVLADGRYGFTLVARSGAGLSPPPPKPGDEPQVWVEVDTARPLAELYAPQPDAERPGCLLLTWKADDRNLPANPVALEWSGTPAGPWTVIGEQLPNTGRYSWQVPDHVPVHAYLRLSVRDSAGNSTISQTHEPVLIDLEVPAIHGVRVKPKE